MPDPTQPRKPQQPLRPERKPSDWSPRPIPQPAPERRTADPPTPTLKELTARERQRAALTVGLGAPETMPLAAAGAPRAAAEGGAVTPPVRPRLARRPPRC